MTARLKILVIDASIARAAGGKDAQHPDSVNAREFLRAVHDVGHKLGMTSAIRAEWDRHQSNFSLQWRKTMVARKRFVARAVPEDKSLRNEIDVLPASASDRGAMKKDCHLLEAALAFDKRIASKDDTVHQLFKTSATRVTKIRHLIWVNPLTEADTIQRWLKQGAPDKAVWELKA